MSNPEKIVRASFRAYETKDRSAIEAVIADDFRFTSPLDNGIDRTTYFNRCWPNSESLERFEFVRVIPTGEQVVVTYDAHTKDGRCFRNSEVFTMRDQKIVEVEVYFGWSIPHEAPAGGFKDPEKS